jgi:DNA-binding transcriptional MerR regulator
MKRPQREFYGIGEVCALFDLRPHVLRYWETRFPALAPPKNRAGSRVYRERDLELIALIRHLVHEERFTLEGARLRIEELRAEGAAAEQAAAALERSFVRSLRSELESILVLLDPAVQGARGEDAAASAPPAPRDGEPAEPATAGAAASAAPARRGG